MPSCLAASVLFQSQASSTSRISRSSDFSKVGGAEEDWKSEALAIDEASSRAVLLKVKILNQLNRTEEAIDVLEVFTDHNPKQIDAKAVLGKLGISNVEFYVGDGSSGWPASRLPPSGCFDRIMITAGVPKIPEPLVEQLADGGLIVAPVGGRGVQGLVDCEKKSDKLISRAICDVRFVRLIGKYGFEQ